MYFCSLKKYIVFKTLLINVLFLPLFVILCGFLLAQIIFEEENRSLISLKSAHMTISAIDIILVGGARDEFNQTEAICKIVGDLGRKKDLVFFNKEKKISV